ncbi:hypothetical protein NLM24_00525 [Nocardia zapadnayensis]|uniref:hypothetical protein n=1 Tax=Nocardia rhamnosiphila TaxID=426716 RepID=UPI0022471E69|nr:hypothetical protein [Nocardia zapadnayensis]MCX0269219.1 hypothetical protein [Nocardia zapadnayensis]
MSMRFEVKVSRYGDRWLISAPAFGIRKIVDEESAILSEAYRLIARCGTAPGDFEVELVPGRGPDITAVGNDPAGPVEAHGTHCLPRGASVHEIRTGLRRTNEPMVDDGF